MSAPSDVYRERRTQLAQLIERPLVLFAGQARARHYATNLSRFRAGSHYLYFGGPPIEGASLLIEPKSNGVDGCHLFRAPVGVEDEVWIGGGPSDEALVDASGISSIAEPGKLAEILNGREGGFMAPPCPPTHEWIDSLKLQPANADEMQAVCDLRLYKDSHELTAMRRAADIGVQAHLAAMRMVAPGRHEGEVAGRLHSVYLANEGRCSFTPIVSIHGEILHSEHYVNILEAGQLLLVDAGAEEPSGYASDITRTYPVSASFTPIQRALYDTVLQSMRAGIRSCVVGRRFREIHDEAAVVLCEGLINAGLMRGNAAELVERRAHTLFFPHGLGHLIGLDVHDMEDFGDLAGYAPGRTRRQGFGDKFLRLDRDLEAGMALTVEPGIYLIPAVWQNEEMVRPYHDAVNRDKVQVLLDAGFGGIRIEETIVISDGPTPEVLTESLPSDAEAVCAVVGTG